MDTPFTPKTHISKRIKIWAVILLIAIILASGLAMLTGGKTRLFKGQVGTTPTLSVTTDSAIPVSTIVSPGSPIEVIKLNITAKNSDITVNKIQIQAVSGKDNIEKISLVTGINPDNEIEMTPQTNPDYYAANPNINLTIKSTPGTYILIKVYIKKDAPANATVKFSIPFLTYIQTTPSDASITGSFPIESKNFTVEQITPKLTVGKPTPEISAGTIIPNKTADVAKFTISNNSNEDIKINSITITNAGNATIYDILGFTLTLLDEEDKNAYKPSIVLTNETQPAATTYIADLSNGLWIIPKDKTSKRLLITGHLKKEAKTGNTLQIGLLEKFSINAVGVTSGQKAEIIMSPEPLMGNIFTISAVEDASVQQAVAAAEKAAADAKKYAEDASAAFQSVKDLLASTDSTLKDLAIKVQQETSTADFAYVEATGAAMKAKNAKTSAEADAAKTEAENAAAKAKTASENAKKYADQALNPKPTLKELCQKGGHSQWYKWDEKKQTCTYQGTEYSTAEDLQNAINAGNQTVLQITCVNTIGAEWQPPNCKFNGNLYTNAENLNAAVEAAKQPEEQAPSDFENLCKKIGWGEWNSQTKKCKLTMDNKEYSDEAELKKGLKNFFKNTCIQQEVWDDSTSTCTMQNGASFKFDDLWNIIKEYEPSEVIAITSNLTDFIRLCDSLPNAQWNSSAYKCTFNSQEYQTYYALKTAVKDIVKQSCIASQNAWNDSTDTCTGNNYSYSFNEVLSAIMTGQTKFGNFTVTTDLGVIKTGTSQPVPAQPQLSIISPSEIQAGQILVGSSTNVLKLKFQAPLDADITVSSIKITTQGSAPVSDLQSFKLIEGANVIGSSTNIGIETLIATPSFTILKDASRELALNVIAKPNAVKDNMYLFRIQANTDISASTQNIFLNPAPLSSQLFTIATAGVTPPPPPPPTTPTVSLTASPATSQTAGQSITFTMTINNPSGGLYNYYLDLGDGKTVKTLPGSTSTTATFDNNSYNEAKTYTVKGTVTMVINNVATIITAPDLNYTITAVAPPPPPPPPPSPEITNLQNQLTLMQQQFANSQTAQSTAQIAALNKQISDLIALAAAKDAADAAKTKASEEKGKKPKEKAKTPIETVEMWGAGPVPTPTYIPPVPQPMPTYIPPAPGAGAQMYPMYASAPSLGYSQKLVKAPDKSNTGPEVLLYFIAVGAANAAWWIRRKIKK